MTKGSLMVKSIAEFLPALSDNWSWKPIFALFESGHFRQVLLYSSRPTLKANFYGIIYVSLEHSAIILTCIKL